MRSRTAEDDKKRLLQTSTQVLVDTAVMSHHTYDYISCIDENLRLIASAVLTKTRDMMTSAVSMSICCVRTVYSAIVSNALCLRWNVNAIHSFVDAGAVLSISVSFPEPFCSVSRKIPRDIPV